MEKKNKLIAEFMDLDTEVFKSGKVNYYYYDKVSKQEIFLEAHELSYNLSWDWLMPVVDKIKSISGKLPTHIGNIPNDEDWESNNFLSTNIEETYRAVIEFIKDYNQNN